MTQCNNCGANIPRGTGHDYQIEVATGRSGGSWSFGTRKGKNGQTSISPRYYTGRTYYKKVWVTECDDCYNKKAQSNMGCGAWIVVVVLCLMMVTCMFSPNKNKPGAVEQPKVEQHVPETVQTPVWKDLTPEEWQKELENSKNNSETR